MLSLIIYYSHQKFNEYIYLLCQNCMEKSHIFLCLNLDSGRDSPVVRGLAVGNCFAKNKIIIVQAAKEAAKKVLFLVVRPLRP